MARLTCVTRSGIADSGSSRGPNLDQDKNDDVRERDRDCDARPSGRERSEASAFSLFKLASQPFCLLRVRQNEDWCQSLL